ncbi:MAG: hypothetical protein QM485_09385 [Flavobacteriaceae bacterium]
MMLHTLPLVNYNNGIIMIAVFAMVCVALVTMLVLFMNSGKKKED